MWAFLTAAAAIAEIVSLAVAWLAYRGKRHVDRELELLRLVPEGERAELIEKLVDRYGVSAAGLAKKDRFTVVRETIRQRAEAFRRALWAGVVSGAMLAALTAYAITRDHEPDLYRVRVAVRGPDGLPVADAEINTSVGGEVLAGDKGWEISIPRSRRGQTVTIFASRPTAFLEGSQRLELGDDPEPPAVEVLLARAEVDVQGTVVDAAGRGIAGATVSVVGYQDAASPTSETGEFRLPAHAAEGQSVRLRIARAGQTAEFLVRAGKPPVRVVWDRP